jgi:hypothetical protein
LMVSARLLMMRRAEIRGSVEAVSIYARASTSGR